MLFVWYQPFCSGLHVSNILVGITALLACSTEMKNDLTLKQLYGDSEN